MKKEKFKIGDRVEVIKTVIGAESAVVHDVGTINCIAKGAGLPYGVKFDRPRDRFHTMNGRVENGLGYWCSEEMLKHVNHKPIIIYQNGNEVIALNKETNEKAVAKCSPHDEFNFEIGAKLAFERLTKSEPEPKLKPYNGKFEPYNGKFVCIACHPVYAWTIGKIYEVIDGRVECDNRNRIPTEPVRTFKELEAFLECKAIEIVE